MKTRYRVRRQTRYERLKAVHFLPVEAASLSSLRTLNYLEIRQMIQTRKNQFNAFQKRAYNKGWSKVKSKQEWLAYLKRWYKRQGFLKHKTDQRRKNEPWWQWFQAVSDKLPPESRYTKLRESRRRARRKKAAMTVGERVNISKWINELTRAIHSETDIETKKQHILQRDRLRLLLRGNRT